MLFADELMPGARSFPSARPTRAQTVEAFADRMRGLTQQGVPRTSSDRALAIRVHGPGM